MKLKKIGEVEFYSKLRLDKKLGWSSKFIIKELKEQFLTTLFEVFGKFKKPTKAGQTKTLEIYVREKI